jgi:hypothetical protein
MKNNLHEFFLYKQTIYFLSFSFQFVSGMFVIKAKCECGIDAKQSLLGVGIEATNRPGASVSLTLLLITTNRLLF